MEDNRKLIYFQMQMLQAEIELKGMIAENKQREHLKLSMAYVYEDFMNLVEKYSIHHNAFPFRDGG